MADLVHEYSNTYTASPGVTPAIDVAPGAAVLVTVSAAQAGTAPTLGLPTATGLTFAQIDGGVVYGSRRSLGSFIAVNTTGSTISQPISVPVGGTPQEFHVSVETKANIYQADPASGIVVGSIGVGAILNLPQAGRVVAGDSVVCAFGFEDGADAFAIGSPHAELGSIIGGSNVRSLKTAQHASDVTPFATWTNSGNACGGIAFLLHDASWSPPSLPVTDDGVRADAVIGGCYAPAIGTGLVIASNRITGVQNEERASYRTAEEYASAVDQEVEFELVSTLNGQYVGGMLRSTGAGGARNGYLIDVGNNFEYYLSRYVNGVGANLATGSVPGNLQIGDIVRCRVTGDAETGITLELYINDVLIDSAVDDLDLYESGLMGPYAYSNGQVGYFTFRDVGAGASDGVVANADSATSTSTPTGVQVHAGTVAGATSATSLSTPAGASGGDGQVASLASTTETSTPAGVQHHAGAVASAGSATSTSSPAGTQVHVGSVASAATATQLSEPAGGGEGEGIVAGATSATSTSAPAGVQLHQGAIASASSSSTASTPAGTQVHVGAVADASTATELSTPAGSGGSPGDGVVASAASSTSISSTAGTQMHVGAVAAMASTTVASSPTGAQLHVGAVDNAATATALSTPAGSGGQSIDGSVAGAASATSMSVPTGLQVHQGVIAGLATATMLTTPGGTQLHLGVVADAFSATRLGTGYTDPPARRTLFAAPGETELIAPADDRTLVVQPE